jgi:hypothetical protein
LIYLSGIRCTQQAWDEAFGEEAADLLQPFQRSGSTGLGCTFAPWMTGVPAETI